MFRPRILHVGLGKVWERWKVQEKWVSHTGIPGELGKSLDFLKTSGMGLKLQCLGH